MVIQPREKAPALSPQRWFPAESSLVLEIQRMLICAAALALLLCLVSYSAQDPSWSTWSTTGSIHNWLGRAGSLVADLLLQVLGLAAFSIVILLGLRAKRLSKSEEQKVGGASYVLWTISLSCLLEAIIPARSVPWGLQHGGGLLGHGITTGLKYGAGPVGAGLLAFLALLASTILVFRFQIVSWFVDSVPRTFHVFLNIARWMGEKIRRSGREALKTAPPVAAATAADVGRFMPIEPTLLPPGSSTTAVPFQVGAHPAQDNEISFLTATKKPLVTKEAKRYTPRLSREFTLPSLNLLSGKAESKSKPVDKSWYLEKASILVQKLKDFGVEGEVVNICPGPVITVYEFKPASGVKIKEIANLSDDLTLALSVLSVRIVAPIPGKPVVGIEIPSPHREMVFFKDLIQETPFYSPDIKIPIVIGRLASGEPVVAGLASMPHLLVAGSTGTGKSVFINTLIGSLLYRFTPNQLKLILVDPKMVELSGYEGIPHLLLPVVVDSKKAAMALRWTVDEMERRYSLMHQFGVRHLDAYNERVAEMAQGAPDLKPLPYIVVVIDEYADLMAVVPKDVELSIARLAQKARAAGIHLVLATQRPSTDVVTGTIKANFPSRISFRVASSVDSKTILDRTGADRLLGHGDMLFHSAGFTTLKRMQGAFISDAEITRVVEYLKSQGEPEYDERILQYEEQQEALASGEGEGQEGELYDQAVRLVTERGEASISLIQRHLRIGYNRAATLMEQMERNGVVGPETSASKRRTVIAQAL